ncbi:hypothetical protein QE152_g5033 [Popillia japonica]|uniref:Uncharacterized protein n=1 Tax=Popillia japonica TaxID=7064 RepID=A0AAW1MY33_POPJA
MSRENEARTVFAPFHPTSSPYQPENVVRIRANIYARVVVDKFDIYRRRVRHWIRRRPKWDAQTGRHTQAAAKGISLKDERKRTSGRSIVPYTLSRVYGAIQYTYSVL